MELSFGLWRDSRYSWHLGRSILESISTSFTRFIVLNFSDLYVGCFMVESVLSSFALLLSLFLTLCVRDLLLSFIPV